jgi:uncharacterized repeat protein (TIGR03803 family)
MRNHFEAAGVAAAALFVLIATIALPNLCVAQIYTPLDDFGTESGDPQAPQGHFAQARDGNLYNTSSSGGEHGYGTVFQLTPSGKMKVLWSFTGAGAKGGPPGGHPTSGLTLGTDGNLYGTTIEDGTSYKGTVFRITTGGILTVLYNFTGEADGQSPAAAPVQGLDGDFYGSSSDDIKNYGAIYKMTPAGVLKAIYEFTGRPDINYEHPQALVLGTDGNFYGTTRGGGAGYGMVFKITPKGALTMLHEFTGSPSDGQLPTGALIEAADGNFYGTTEYGGTGQSGTVYRMTPAGEVTILHNFKEDKNGFRPLSGLTQGTDGNFYGGTYQGGVLSGGGAGKGVLYQITPEGSYSILYNDFIARIGTHPDDPLIQHTNGTFYGDTYEGGDGGKPCNYECGTLYSLNMELAQFVTFVPAQSSGKVGATVGILGQGLTGTTRVAFAGTSASFKVVSDTFLTATVPAGAKTGTVSVSRPGGVLTSNKVFHVTPPPTAPDVTLSATSLTLASPARSR